MVKNTIVVYIKEGRVVTDFFEETIAREQFKGEAVISMFTLDPEIDAKNLLPICPSLRNGVEAAQERLRVYLEIDKDFDAAGLPKDRAIRRAAHQGVANWYMRQMQVV